MGKQQNDETIRGVEVDNVLEGACNDRTRVKIIFDAEQPGFYSNMVHLFSNYILFDGFTPEDIQEKLPKDTPLETSFAFRSHGYYSFNANYLGIKGSVGSQFMVERPTQITHIQRRRSYRVEPSATLPAEILAIGKARTGDKVWVENISIEGVCLSFPRPASIRIGARVQGIRIRLANEKELLMDAVVRSAFRSSDGRFRLGMQWEVLDHEQHLVLQRYITQCQRMEAKRRR